MKFYRVEENRKLLTYASGNKQVGDTGGEEEHRLTVEELAEHYHEQDEHNYGVTADRKYGGKWGRRLELEWLGQWR